MAAAVALLISALIGAQGSVMHGVNKEVDRLVARDLAPLAPASGAGGVAVVVHLSGRTFFFNYGYADQADKRPISSDSLFNVGSVRKVFEAVLVAQAVQRGELKLDDPVNKYVTELQGDYIRRVTIGELLAHTSGLLLPTDHPPWPNDHYSLQGFLDALNAYAPEGGEQPGKQRIYAHSGYILLQLVLERRYGKPIAELIAHGITAPLGMTSTVVPERGPNNRALMDPALMARAVQGYARDSGPIGLPGNQQGYYDFSGTGQMFSSARDLAVLLAACLGDAPVAPELRQALQTTQRELFAVDARYGQAMAWEINNVPGAKIIDKPGGLNNASAYIGLIPELKIGVVILSNRGDVAPFEIARNSLLPELARMVRTPIVTNAQRRTHG
jgi:beta-lactamase class C